MPVSRRKSTIRHHSDKPGVAQFREFADKLYAKRRVHEHINELNGGLVLDEELAAAGLRDVNDEECRGWSAVHWRAAGWPDIGLRGRINEARRLLDEAARARRTRSTCTRSEILHAPMTSRTRSAPAMASAPAPNLLLYTAHCTRLRLLIKLVWRSEWAAAALLRGERIDGGVRVATIAEDGDLRGLSVSSNLRESLRVAWLEVHGRRRVDNMLQSTVTSARAQESKLRAAAMRDINTAMERSPRGAIEFVAVGTGDDASALTGPAGVVVECCEFSARRMSSIQPKRFRKYGAMEGRTVRVALGNRTRRGLVKKTDNDGHCTLQYDGDEHTTSGVRHGAMCLVRVADRALGRVSQPPMETTHGGCHEVTGDVYKHITASAQRRLSIGRVGVKEGAASSSSPPGAAAGSATRLAPLSLLREALVLVIERVLLLVAVGRGLLRLLEAAVVAIDAVSNAPRAALNRAISASSASSNAARRENARQRLLVLNTRVTRGRLALDRNEIQNLNDQVEERVAAVCRLLVRHLNEAAGCFWPRSRRCEVRSVGGHRTVRATPVHAGEV